MTLQRAMRLVAGLSALGSVWVLAGCGASFSGSGATAVKATPSALTGTVRGGSQPISGSQVYLYAVSTSQDAGPASSLLNSPGYVTTLSDGSFSLAGDFTCPAGAYVYLLAKGGNPGLASGTNNGEIALAAGLGLCSAITSSTHVSLNEVTTVATAYSLAAYASSETNIGANNAVANTLGSAFANIPELIDMGTGYALTTNASGGIVPQATIDSLANALAACVSSDGTGTQCSSLMTAANVTGANGTPVDTFQAALKIAQNPTLDVQGIFNLPPSGSPFQPSLTGKPNDWTVTVHYPGTASPPPVYYVSMTPGSATIYQNGSQTFAATVNGSSSGSGFSYEWYTTATAGLMTDTTVAGQAGQSTYCSANAQSMYVPNTTPTVTTSTFDSVEVSVFTGPGCATANFIGSIATRISVIPDVSTTAIPVFTTTPYSGTVVLPTGTKLTPDQLSVITSVTSTTPLPSGAFTVTEYANGEQLVQVLSPAGNPMLLGWMDSSHPTINASTTAEVLAFFALGGHLMLNESDRNAMIAGIPQQSGFAALVQAISTEIAANPDAFSTTNANVQAAVAAFYTAVTGLTAPAVRQPAGGATPAIGHIGGAAAKPNSVLPTPSATSAQSGITFTGQDPTQAYATNAFRRRAHVFVLRQNDVTFEPGGPQNYMYTPDAVAVTDFDLAPTVGLTGGVTGAVIDIFKAYFGNQPYAYNPINSDPFSLPVTSGFDGTTYQVLTVGAGGSGAPSPVTLTDGQKAVLVTTAVNGLVNDAIVPFLSNVGFGSGSMADNSGAAVPSAAAAFNKAFVGDLSAQVLSLTQMISGEQDKIVAGNYKEALNDLFWGFGAQQFFNGMKAAIGTAVGQSGYNIGSMSLALGKFFQLTKIVDTGLQVLDSSIYTTQLAQSDNVDQWTLLSVGTKVTLTSSTPTINGIGNSGLTATVLGVSNTNGYSYQWTLTPAVSSNSTIGTLSEVGGGGRVNQTSYCSSSPNATYYNTPAAVDSLMMPQADVVTVTAYPSANCGVLFGQLVGVKVGNPVSATITTDPTPNVFISPTSETISEGDTAPLAATVSVVTNTTGYSYKWTVTPVAPSTTVSGSLTEVLSGGQTGLTGQTSYCSTSPNASYVSTLTGILTTAVTDQVTVSGYSAPGCVSASQVGQSASSQITTQTVHLGITPSPAYLDPGTMVTLTAKLPHAIDTTGYSYQWTITPATGGTLGGTLTDTGGTGQTGLTSYCTSSNQTTYVSTSLTTISIAVTDTLTVTAYNNSGCNAVDQVVQPVSSTVNTDPLAVPLNGNLVVDYSGPPVPLGIDHFYGIDDWTIGYGLKHGLNTELYTGFDGWYSPEAACIPPDVQGKLNVLAEVIAPDPTAQQGGGGQGGTLTQTFSVPTTAQSLSLKTVTWFGAGQIQVNVIVNGVSTKLGDIAPAGLYVYADPPYAGGSSQAYQCTGAGSTVTSIPFSMYAGQTVTLQLYYHLPGTYADWVSIDATDWVAATAIAVQ